MRPPIVSIVGTSDSGKTTLLERLIPELVAKGYRIGVVKHDLHGFDMDREGKDSWRLKRAGAKVVIVSSPSRIALIEDVDKDHSLEELRERFLPKVDLVLSEGYKRDSQPKIEVYRQARGRELLCTEGDNLVAVASDVPLDIGIPCLDLNDPGALADLIEEKFLRSRKAP